MYKIILVLCISFLLFSGCSDNSEESAAAPQTENTQQYNNEEETETYDTNENDADELSSTENNGDYSSETVEYGTYNISTTWVKSDDMSSDYETIYLQKDKELAEPQSNISVYCFETEYTAEDYNLFLADITKQISQQLGVNDFKADKIDSDDKTVIVVSFDVPDVPPEYKIHSTMYYILSDTEKKAVQITARDLYDDVYPNVTETALQIIDSFVWN